MCKPYLEAQETRRDLFAASPRDNSWRRVRLLGLTAAGGLLGLLTLLPQAPRLVWNFTDSVPLGLYLVVDARAHTGDLVVIVPPSSVAALLADTGALARGRVLLKPLAAQAGDLVCRTSGVVSVNGAPRASARETLRTGRRLPTWSGCRRLSADEILVLSDHPSSFDGRYFGPIDRRCVLGVARPLATYRAHAGEGS